MTFDSFRELLKGNRSYRRFDHSRPVSEPVLESLVDLARYCASGRNLQPLKYRIVCAPQECEALYPALKWAGYYTDWDGPEPGERPVAYLVQCLDTDLTQACLCDDGLQLEAITLGASTLGIHGVIIKAFNAATVAEVLKLPASCKPHYVLALGYPAEKVVLTTTDGTPDADIRYFRSPDGTHNVPKRPLGEILIKP